MPPFRCLREFVSALDARGELLRIRQPVSAHLEIAALADLAMKAPGGGKALLFENVAGSAMPVLVNAFGSRRRLKLALGVRSVEEIPRRISALMDAPVPSSLADIWKLLPLALDLKGIPPKRSKAAAPCQEVVLQGEAVDLDRLPVLTCWPGDGGPFVTLPCVFTKDPTTGHQNVGMYRLQVYDRRTTGMHWHVHKDGSRTHRAHSRAGRRTEVAVAIGTDPVVTYCATAPLPPGVDELMLAGFIRRKPVTLAKCVSVDLWVPAEAEIVLEGYVEPGEERVEGPFGDHTGVYSPAEPYPVFHVTALTHRRSPIYFATVVGIPPMEDVWLGLATERIFLPLVRSQWPEVTEMSLPPEGVFHNLAVVGMDKHYAFQARRLFHGFWGTGQMSLTKMVVAVDAGVPVHDPRAVARVLLDRLRIPDDLVWAEGALDALDHSSPHALWGGKLGVDATTKLPGEPGAGEPLAPRIPPPAEPDVLAALRVRFPGLRACLLPAPGARLTLALLVLRKTTPGEGARLARAALELPGIDVAVAVEGDGTEPLAFLAWRALSSVDPVRDVVAVGAKLAVDATIKGPAEGHPRPWPPEVSHPPEVRDRAERLAQEVGLI